MGVVISVHNTVGGHSHGSGRIAQVLRGRAGAPDDMLYRVSWGTLDTMELLFSRVCQTAPISNQNGVDVLNIIHDDLSAHFVDLLATPEARYLRGLVVRCFKPSSLICLVVSRDTMTTLMARGAHYQQTFLSATRANAHIRIGDRTGRVLAVN